MPLHPAAERERNFRPIISKCEGEGGRNVQGPTAVVSWARLPTERRSMAEAIVKKVENCIMVEEMIEVRTVGFRDGKGSGMGKSRGRHPPDFIVFVPEVQGLTDTILQE